jgi:hypothetical protein
MNRKQGHWPHMYCHRLKLKIKPINSNLSNNIDVGKVFLFHSFEIFLRTFMHMLKHFTSLQCHAWGCILKPFLPLARSTWILVGVLLWEPRLQFLLPGATTWLDWRTGSVLQRCDSIRISCSRVVELCVERTAPRLLSATRGFYVAFIWLWFKTI